MIFVAIPDDSKVQTGKIAILYELPEVGIGEDELSSSGSAGILQPLRVPAHSCLLAISDIVCWDGAPYLLQRLLSPVQRHAAVARARRL